MCNLTKRDSEKKDQTSCLVSNFSETFLNLQDSRPRKEATYIAIVIVVVTVIVFVIVFVNVIVIVVIVIFRVIVIIIYRIGDLSKEAILQAIKDKDLRFLQVRIRDVKGFVT